MPADGPDLPGKCLVGLGGVVSGEHAADETTNDVPAEGKASRQVALASPLEARAVEECAKGQHVGAVVEFTEELLGRKQRSILPSSGGGDKASMAHRPHAGKGVHFLEADRRVKDRDT